MVPGDWRPWRLRSGSEKPGSGCLTPEFKFLRPGSESWRLGSTVFAERNPAVALRTQLSGYAKSDTIEIHDRKKKTRAKDQSNPVD